MSAQLDFEWELMALVDRYRPSVSKTELVSVLMGQVNKVFKRMSGELKQLELEVSGAPPIEGRVTVSGGAPPSQ